MPGGDGPDRGVELVGVDVLEQEAAGAGAERTEDVVVDLECGEHDDPHVGEVGVGGDLSSGFDPVGPWHADVHQHDVGSCGAGELDGAAPAVGLADDDQVIGELEHRP